MSTPRAIDVRKGERMGISVMPESGADQIADRDRSADPDQAGPL
jgi:hypothetical protein